MESLNISSELVSMGFQQHFPFVTFFTKDNVHVHTCYRPTKKEAVQDDSNCMFCTQIVVFELPRVSKFLYKHDQNAVQFIKSLYS